MNRLQIRAMFGRAPIPKVFVTGMPKSGTTAIAMLMGVAAQSKVASDPFSLLDERKVKFRDELFAGRLQVITLFRAYANLFRGDIVKDPNLAFFHDDLRTAFPSARWVFTLREPRSNIRSVLNRLGLPGNDEEITRRLPTLSGAWRRVLEGRTPQLPGSTPIERMAHRWRVQAEVYERASPAMQLARYEAFNADKPGVIRHLVDASGLAVRASIEAQKDRQFQRAGDNSAPLSEYFGADELARIDAICGPLAERLGYAR